MKERLLRIGKWVAYPLFYLFCLGLFGYLTFPVNRLKDRIIAEFERNAKPGQRLTIDSISTYWFTGVELSGLKVTMPPDGPTPMALPRSGDDLAASSAAPAPKDTTITIDEAHARVRILPLLIGRVRVDFWASAFGGEVKGTVPVGGAGGDVALELTKVDLSKIEPLTQVLVSAAGLPIKGMVSGKLELSAVEGKWSKASGDLDMTIEGMVAGDGKTKIMNQIVVPPAKLGTVTISAEAKDGTLKVNKLSAPGPDIELIGDGTVALREPWNACKADLYIKFKINDVYRTKNEDTKSIFGAPGQSLPGIIDLRPEVKRAKRADGFYGLHLSGPLKSLKVDPSTADPSPSSALPLGSSSVKRGRGTEWKKPPGVNFNTPGGNDDAPTPPSPPPPRPAATEEQVKPPDAQPMQPPPPAQPPPPPPRPAEVPNEQPAPARTPAQPNAAPEAPAPTQ